MKKIASSIILVLMLFVIAACSPKEGSIGGSITVMVPDWAAPTDEMLDEFFEETGVDVTLNIVSWDDIRDKLNIASAADTYVADVVEVDWSWTGEFVSQNLLEELKFDSDEFLTADSFMQDNKYYAIPYANDFRVAFYNKDIYQKAGINRAPKTFEDVYNDSKKIKEEGLLEYPFTFSLNAVEATHTSLIWLTYALTGQVFENSGNINKANVTEALSYINRMLEEDLLDPSLKSASGLDSYRKITSGDASFLVGPTSFVSRVNNPNESVVVDKVETIALPGKTDLAKYTMGLPEGLGVLKTSKNIEGAKAYVEWFTSYDTQLRLNEELSTIPTRKAALEYLVDNNIIKSSGALIEMSEKIVSPYPNGIPTYYAKMANIIFNEVNNMANGLVTPEQAGQKIYDEMAKII